jgi:hypothetical protein
VLTLDLLINGLIIGVFYALMAVGLSLIFGILRIVNFAHGEFYMLGAYVDLPAPIGIAHDQHRRRDDQCRRNRGEQAVAADDNRPEIEARDADQGGTPKPIRPDHLLPRAVASRRCVGRLMRLP